MDKIPRATRQADNDSVYRQPAKTPNIKTDKVTPAVEGYFRIPAVWIGEMPESASILKLNPQVHHAVVVEKDLCSSIKVRVQRDGTFLFDFSSWTIAPQTLIPGYDTPGPGIPHRAPKETEDAVLDSERFAVLRAQAMNVHQLCLATSEWLLTRSSSGMGLPVTAADTLKGLTFDDCIRYGDTIYGRALERNVLNNSYGIPRQQPYARRVLNTEVVTHSLELFDQILLFNDAAFIQMVEAAYLAGGRFAEGRLGEAITLAWAVCEQLVSTAWERLLNDTTGSDRMTGPRKKKLKGRDYTASVMTEVLELENRIRHDLYSHIEEARRARNRWAHELQEPTNGQVIHAIRAIEGLFQEIHGIRVLPQLNSPSPGVPGWNVWIREAMKSREEE